MKIEPFFFFFFHSFFFHKQCVVSVVFISDHVLICLLESLWLRLTQVQAQIQKNNNALMSSGPGIVMLT